MKTLDSIIPEYWEEYPGIQNPIERILMERYRKSYELLRRQEAHEVYDEVEYGLFDKKGHLIESIGVYSAGHYAEDVHDFLKKQNPEKYNTLKLQILTV
jgi:stalled ribosome rescue protein Dom34